MLQYHVAVCDDERFAADAIATAAERELAHRGVQAEIEVYTALEDLAKRMDSVGFDLVLLDIEMPGVDGIQFGRALREIGFGTDIIYVSNSEERVFESLSLRPLGFVRKSHFNADMAEAIETFVRERRKQGTNRTITLKMAHAMGTFDIDEIAYVEAHRREKIVHLVNGRTEEVLTTLDEMGERLAPYGFFRVHKGFLVNFAHVRQLTPQGFVVGKDLVPIGRSKVAEARRAYMDYLSNKNAIML
ncbi:LytR/AlgR family response regulator transcription factor [Olsenella profusa]|uniref:Response regulator transcription factor n=1 Tax=Olsenella profusa TaxID=138595 RepID=A0ABS2F2E9_9ACTN|nr:LytTR family DNA-binding domain-containing protein [Olsenella profusa]MBM6774747.1 response regulator transcription factor [Olsenella profusa]